MHVLKIVNMSRSAPYRTLGIRAASFFNATQKVIQFLKLTEFYLRIAVGTKQAVFRVKQRIQMINCLLVDCQIVISKQEQGSVVQKVPKQYNSGGGDHDGD
jgi:hypothetical protein